MGERKPLEFRREERERAVAALRQYLLDEFDLDVGDLKAGFLLEFFLKEFGPTVHNRAIADARAYFDERSADLEGIFGLPEFPHSSRRT